MSRGRRPPVQASVHAIIRAMRGIRLPDFSDTARRSRRSARIATATTR
jgi:hypothetical protein